MKKCIKSFFAISMLAVILQLTATCQVAGSKTNQPGLTEERSKTNQPNITVEITKRDGEKITVTDFKRSFFYVSPDSYNIDIEVPINIISHITFSDNEATVFLGDNSTIKGHWEAYGVFVVTNTDLGETGIACEDIKELVFKHNASESYSAPSHGNHRAVIYLKGGKKIELTGATFRATKFDRDPKYKYPLDIGVEYPNSVRFDADTNGAYNILAWEKIKTITSLDSNASSGVVDCKITTQSGRELIGWANYWWTANRIEGIVPVGKYKLAFIFTFSAAPNRDYEKVELQ